MTDQKPVILPAPPGWVIDHRPYPARAGETVALHLDFPAGMSVGIDPEATVPIVRGPDYRSVARPLPEGWEWDTARHGTARRINWSKVTGAAIILLVIGAEASVVVWLVTR